MGLRYTLPYTFPDGLSAAAFRLHGLRPKAISQSSDHRRGRIDSFGSEWHFARTLENNIP